jgi:ribosomal protein S18 acetylase RimI-like enzyme
VRGQPIRIEPAAAHADRIAADIPGLIHATGPASYDYQFGADCQLLNLMVAESWRTPETLYAAATSTVALADDGTLLGLETGFDGPNFYTFKDNLVTVAGALVAAGKTDPDELRGLVARAEKASYLNAHIPDGVYYILALAVPEPQRGRGIGAQLLRHAIGRARAAGQHELQLDVLSDNPAVRFYRAMGLEIAAETAVPELTRDHGFPTEYRMTMRLA